VHEHRYNRDAEAEILAAVKPVYREWGFRAWLGPKLIVTGYYKAGNWEAAALSKSDNSSDVSFSVEAFKVKEGMDFQWHTTSHSNGDVNSGHKHSSSSVPDTSES
jgi:hypothetical protein